MELLRDELLQRRLLQRTDTTPEWVLLKRGVLCAQILARGRVRSEVAHAGGQLTKLGNR
jgi:hypothetical protein